MDEETKTTTSQAEEFENFLGFIGGKALPALKMVIDGLKGKCKLVQNFLNFNYEEVA